MLNGISGQVRSWRLALEGFAAWIRNELAQAASQPGIQAPAVEAEKLLRDTLRDAEWCEKRVHVCDGPVLQHWKLEVYLPIVAGSGMSAEQALDSALGVSNVPVQHTASQQGEN